MKPVGNSKSSFSMPKAARAAAFAAATLVRGASAQENTKEGAGALGLSNLAAGLIAAGFGAACCLAFCCGGSGSSSRRGRTNYADFLGDGAHNDDGNVELTER